jgi:hypothetical protein
MTTDDFCFYLQNRLIQTSQTGGQWYSDTSPFSIPWSNTLACCEYLSITIGKSFVTLAPESLEQQINCSTFIIFDNIFVQFTFSVLPSIGYYLYYVDTI